MRRIIVPLDGTERSVAILPDARRLAGPDGEVILVQDATAVAYGPLALGSAQDAAVEVSNDYLDTVAAKLRDRGVRTETHTTTGGSARIALAAAADDFRGDMTAIATHGRTGASRLVHGSVALSMLAHSPVPVLLRHIDNSPDAARDAFEPPADQSRRLLVPLDGSELAESALPLAVALASEWKAEVVLVQVVPDATMLLQASAWGAPLPVAVGSQQTVDDSRDAGQSYLVAQSAKLAYEPVSMHVLEGHVLDRLCQATRDFEITDVIIASHGRGGLPRVILGSVADGLIHRLHLPVIVVPALATKLRSAPGPAIVASGTGS